MKENDFEYIGMAGGFVEYNYKDIATIVYRSKKYQETDLFENVVRITIHKLKKEIVYVAMSDEIIKDYKTFLELMDATKNKFIQCIFN